MIKDKMLELEARRVELQNIIDEEKLNIPIPLVEEELIFWLENFAKRDPNDENFRECLVDAFINKIVLFNDKMLITFNVRNGEHEKLTVEQIIADFDNDNSTPEKFELYQVGAAEWT